jgi:hypothetical protein
MHEPVRSLTITSARSMSTWSGHAEVTGPGYRQVVPGSSPAWAAADEANGEGEG